MADSHSSSVFQWSRQREAARSFATSEDVSDFLALLSSEKGVVSHDEQDRHDELFARIIKAIRAGRLLLNYVPPTDNTVMLPEPEVDYLQAVFYWCAFFNETVPRLVEAHARCARNPSVENVRKMLARIKHEDAMVQTDAFMFAHLRESGPAPLR